MTVLPNNRKVQEKCLSTSTRKGRAPSFYSTLSKEVFHEGEGLFTGIKVQMRLLPAPLGTGIVFQRLDLPKAPLIPARLAYVQKTPRCTILGKEGFFVQTVEHLLSALYSLEIDNVIIQLDAPEVPIDDGSSKVFVDLIEEAKVSFFSEEKKLFSLKEMVSFSSGDTHLIALPDETFRISYTMDYPQSSFIGSQYLSLPISKESYKKEVASSRTFSLYEELQEMLEKGLLQGAGLKNGVVIKEDAVLNPEGLRYKNEMVRHKILDLLGDLSLLGISFVAHIIAIRSGHFSNVAFARALERYLQGGIS